MANLFGIQLRTGCMCNMGACQMHLGLSDDMLMKLSAVSIEISLVNFQIIEINELTIQEIRTNAKFY